MSIRNCRDFVLFAESVHSADQEGPPNKFLLRVFDSPVGEGKHGEEAPIEDWKQLERWGAQLANRKITPADLGRFAGRLGQLILPPCARQLYISSMSKTEEGDGLRIRLRLPDELARLPWEYALVKLHDGEITPEDYWALDFRISIVRHEALSIPASSFCSNPNQRIQTGGWHGKGSEDQRANSQCPPRYSRFSRQDVCTYAN